MKEEDSLKCKTTKSFSELSISEAIQQLSGLWGQTGSRAGRARQVFSPKGVCATEHLDRSAWRIYVSSDPDCTLERPVNEADSILSLPWVSSHASKKQANIVINMSRESAHLFNA